MSVMHVHYRVVVHNLFKLTKILGLYLCHLQSLTSLVITGILSRLRWQRILLFTFIPKANTICFSPPKSESKEVA